jgi:hypothetical protein
VVRKNSIRSPRVALFFAAVAVAFAILDRLAERAEVFHLEGTSFWETQRRPAPRVTPA